MRTHSWISGVCRVMSEIFPYDLKLMPHDDTFVDLWSLQSYVRHFGRNIFPKHLELMLHEDTFMDLWSVQSYLRHFPEEFGTYAT